MKLVKILLGYVLLCVMFMNFLDVSYAKTPSFTFKKLDTSSGARIFYDNVKPGEKVEGVLRLAVLDDVPTIFQLSFIDSFGGKLEKLKLNNEDSAYFSYTEWINILADMPLYLEGNGVLEVPYTIDVPEGALPGDYAGLFIAAIDSYGDDAKEKLQELKNVENFGTGTKISLGIAIDFFLRVVGEIIPGLEMTSLSYYKEDVSEKFNLVISFKNTGNVILKPRAYVNIKNIWGRELFVGEFPLPIISPYLESSSSIKLSTKDFYLNYGIYDISVDLYYDVFSRELGENLVYLSGKANLRIFYLPWFLFASLAFLFVLFFLILFYKNLLFYLYVRNVKEYIVKQNDTLQIVSQKFKVNPKKIIIVNKIKAPYFLDVGDVLLIPLNKKK